MLPSNEIACDCCGSISGDYHDLNDRFVDSLVGTLCPSCAIFIEGDNVFEHLD